MPAELIKQIAAGSQSIEQVICFDAARRSVANIAFERDDHARSIQALSYLRRRQTDHSSMPSVTGNDRGMGLRFPVRTAFKFIDSAVKDFTLCFHAFAISRIQMLSQTPSFVTVLRIEQLDNCFRCVHATRGIDSWTDAKAKIIGIQPVVFAASSDFDERAQSIVYCARQIRESQRNDSAVFADQLCYIGHRADCYHLEKTGHYSFTAALAK